MTPGRHPAKPTRKLKRRDAWLQVARVTDGRFVEGRRPAKDKVIVSHGPWQVWLDTYVVNTGQSTQTFTRARAYFLGWRGVRVLVRRRNVLDRVVEALGLVSRPSLDRVLTRRYVVKGEPATRIPSLFSGSHLGEAIMSVPSLRLEIKRAGGRRRRDFGESAGVAVCRTSGVVVDPAWLAGMVEVIRQALEGLRRIGGADSRALPGSLP